MLCRQRIHTTLAVSAGGKALIIAEQIIHHRIAKHSQYISQRAPAGTPNDVQDRGLGQVAFSHTRKPVIKRLEHVRTKEAPRAASMAEAEAHRGTMAPGQAAADLAGVQSRVVRGTVQ